MIPLKTHHILQTSRLGSQRGQGLVEAALTLPVVLVLAFGVVALAQLTQAQMGVSAVAREAARSGALADSATDAISQGEMRGREVAEGYDMDSERLQLTVASPTWGRGGEVAASVHYTVSFEYLPLLGWASVGVSGSHTERVDLYRSLEEGESE